MMDERFEVVDLDEGLTEERFEVDMDHGLPEALLDAADVVIMLHKHMDGVHKLLQAADDKGMLQDSEELIVHVEVYPSKMMLAVATEEEMRNAIPDSDGWSADGMSAVVERERKLGAFRLLVIDDEGFHLGYVRRRSGPAQKNAQFPLAASKLER